MELTARIQFCIFISHLSLDVAGVGGGGGGLLKCPSLTEFIQITAI